MKSTLITCAAAACLVMPSTSRGQALAPRDSAVRRIAAGATDTVPIALLDGDYARLSISYPLGFEVRVLRPSGEELRLFVASSMKGTTPIIFVAEGAGTYTITTRNSSQAPAEYRLKYTERASLNERTSAAPAQDEFTSPRIDALKRRVQGGDTNTSAFWKQVAAEGTPLVEPLDANYDLVTFLWRTRYDTRNVYLRARFVLVGPANGVLRLVPGTDVWYFTQKLPKGARTTYSLEPNRPASPDAVQVSAQVDPLNRKPRWNCAAGSSVYRCQSIIELSKAPPEPWLTLRPSVPQGQIEKRSIRSDVQRVTRELTVYTPAGYSRTGRSLPLVVLFDGADYVEQGSAFGPSPDWHGLEMWNNLIFERRMSPMVIVMVHNLPSRRLFDLIANEKFGRFLATELVPWARREYNVTSDARRTVVGGFSAGGFAATYMGITHPEVFGNVLSISGALWWSPQHNGGICGGVCADSSSEPPVENSDATTEGNYVAQLALQRPAPKTRFYLSAGTFEVDRNGEGAAILPENRHLRDILRARGVEVIFNQFVGGHEIPGWRYSLADGLQKLLPGR